MIKFSKETLNAMTDEALALLAEDFREAEAAAKLAMDQVMVIIAHREAVRGWTEHTHQGLCPFMGKTLVEVRFRDGSTSNARHADTFNWRCRADKSDIVAYRVIKADPYLEEWTHE